MSKKLSSKLSRFINSEILGDPKRRTITKTTVQGFHKMGLDWVDDDIAHLFMAGTFLALKPPRNSSALRAIGLISLGLVTFAYLNGRSD